MQNSVAKRLTNFSFIIIIRVSLVFCNEIAIQATMLYKVV